jgi:hypothetical protein
MTSVCLSCDFITNKTQTTKLTCALRVSLQSITISFNTVL